jgi:hypothetical protein
MTSRIIIGLLAHPGAVRQPGSLQAGLPTAMAAYVTRELQQVAAAL